MFVCICKKDRFTNRCLKCIYLVRTAAAEFRDKVLEPCYKIINLTVRDS